MSLPNGNHICEQAYEIDELTGKCKCKLIEGQPNCNSIAEDCPYLEDARDILEEQKKSRGVTDETE